MVYSLVVLTTKIFKREIERKQWRWYGKQVQTWVSECVRYFRLNTILVIDISLQENRVGYLRVFYHMGMVHPIHFVSTTDAVTILLW